MSEPKIEFFPGSVRPLGFRAGARRSDSFVQAGACVYLERGFHASGGVLACYRTVLISGEPFNIRVDSAAAQVLALGIRLNCAWAADADAQVELRLGPPG